MKVSTEKRDLMIEAAHQEFQNKGECINEAVKRDDLIESMQEDAFEILESILEGDDINTLNKIRLQQKWDSIVNEAIKTAVDDCIFYIESGCSDSEILAFNNKVY